MPKRLCITPIDTNSQIKMHSWPEKATNNLGTLNKLPFELINKIFSEFIFKAHSKVLTSDVRTYVNYRTTLLKVSKFFNQFMNHPVFIASFIYKYQNTYGFPFSQFGWIAGEMTTTLMIPQTVTDKLVNSFINKCPNVEHLSWQKGIDVFKHLDKFTQLKKLRGIKIGWFKDEKETDKLPTFLKFTHLVELSISGGEGDPENFKKFWSMINQFKNLEILSLNDFGTVLPQHDYSIDLFGLASLSKLKKLVFAKRSFDLEPPKNPFRFLTNLEKLNISVCNINDKFMEPMGELTKLRSLFLRSCPITGKSLLTLKKLINLQKLVFGSSSITDNDIKEIGGLTKLTDLGLDENTQITDNCFQHLSQLKNLKTLSIHKCTLITIVGLTRIAVTFQNLTFLDLSSTSLQIRQCLMFTSFEELRIAEGRRGAINHRMITIKQYLSQRQNVF